MKTLLSAAKLRRLVGIVVGCFFLFLAWRFCGVWFYLAYVNKDIWKEKTIPLTQETRTDLCTRFQIKDAQLCDSDKTIYGPDFYKYIDKYFEDKEGIITEKEVNERLGPYLQNCTGLAISQSGIEYFKCLYDLAGDDAYHIGVYFYRDGSFWHLTSSTD